jgi:hypothetical protein
MKKKTKKSTKAATSELRLDNWIDRIIEYDGAVVRGLDPQLSASVKPSAWLDVRTTIAFGWTMNCDSESGCSIYHPDGRLIANFRSEISGDELMVFIRGYIAGLQDHSQK